MATTPEKLQLELKDTLEATGYVEVVAASSRKGDVRLLFRVKEATQEQWLKLVHQCLLELNPKYYFFLGVRYFIVEKELRFGWVLILDAEDSEHTDEAVQDMRKLVMRVYLEQTGTHLAARDTAILDDGIEVPAPQMTTYIGTRAQRAIQDLARRQHGDKA